MKPKSFLLKNEEQVNKIVLKILLWSTLIFPLVLLLSHPSINFFPSPFNQLILPSIVGTLCHTIPYLLRKFNANSTIIKYTSIVMSTISVGIVIANPHMYVSLIFLFPISLSLLYFDKKLTKFALVLTLINLVISEYFFDLGRYQLGVINDFWSKYIWDTTICGIELFAMSLIYSMLARRTRNLLESLMGSEEQTEIFNKLKEVMTQSAHSSDILASSVKHLSATMEESSEANAVISMNASNAVESSKQNLKHIITTNKTVENISGVLDKISVQAKELMKISKDTYESAEKNQKLINHAVENMEEIDSSTALSKELMNKLSQRSEQIGKIVEMIAGITRQTNLLALNASIESARAGEHGRGFSVVASEIRQLAEQSTAATKEIADLIKHVQDDTKNAALSIEQSEGAIKAGIDLVRTSGESFNELKKLQEVSTNKAEEVALSSKEAYERGSEIVKIVSDTEALTKESMSDVEFIASSIQQELLTINEIKSAVETVDEIAGALLKLSSSISESNLCQ
ncbi:MAG: hypothetical protein KAX49_03175 [Halanaerobiales bacterium]|nr:hypothetical protein [Halanaerobiales bacterium]